MTASLRILVVDDDANFREALSMLLEDEGHVVATCSTGGGALAKLSAGRFDVLLTDLVMPGMSGVELVTAARDDQPALRCFIMSGHPESGGLAGVGWIDKPIDISRLLVTLSAAV